MQEKNEKKKKGLLSVLLKRVRIRHFLVLALLLIGNSFAWFIYVDTVRNSIDVRVKSWRIDFTDGDQPVTQNVNITVTDAMPGMTTYTHTINANNYSEVGANVSFTILRARIMDEDFETAEGRADRGLPLSGYEMTSSQLVTRLQSYYPFSIILSLSSLYLNPENGVANFVVQMSWPFESGNDTWDTVWGMKAYDWKTSNPSSPSIELNIKISISQAST